MAPHPEPPRSRREFKIAIICALPLEAECVLAMFDKTWDRPLGKAKEDLNAYSLGVIARHNVVLAHMPGMGKVSATSVAAGVRLSFTSIEYAFVVGICGGVPFNGKREVILGDVIVSQLLVQYDLGKQHPEGFETKTAAEDSLSRPSQEIRSLLAKLNTSHHRTLMQQEITTHLLAIQKTLPETAYPGSESDRLYVASYLHKHRAVADNAPCVACESSPEHRCQDALKMRCKDLGCEESELVQRDRLSKAKLSDMDSSDESPQLHIGRIGTADTVLKSGTDRDRIASEHSLIAFEMEGAGVWDYFSNSLVIKGVCDYADSHKNKQWQDFAAAAAAACMKSFLREIGTPEDSYEYEEPQRSLWYMPFEQSDLERLVGRTDKLEALEHNLFQRGRHSKTALLGLGGVGKSRLAMEVAYRTRAPRPDCSIFWVQATDSLSFERDYLAIGKLMQVPGLEQSGADDKSLVCKFLGQQSAGEWLLILDNADDPALWAEKDPSATDTSSSLIEHLPKSRTGSILVTTRSRRVASHLAGKDLVELDDMKVDDAEQMLKNLLEKPDILNDRESTQQLLHNLTCLPLAIVQAAAYLNKNDESIKTYLKLLRQPEDDVIELLSQDFNDEGRYKTALNPIATTWLVSFRQIEQQNRVAADYLAFASCLSEKNIPRSLFPPAESMNEMVDALAVLRGYGFFRRHDDSDVHDPDGPLYDMHRLVRLATRNWLRRENDLTMWTANAFRRMMTAFPSVNWETRNVWMLYMPHAQILCDSKQCQDLRERYELLNEMAFCLQWTGKDKDAVGLLEIVYRWAESTLGGDDEFKIRVCLDLGDFLNRLGRHSEAMDYVSRALEKSREALGMEHRITIECMLIMGKLYSQQARWQQGELILKEGIEAGKKVLGPQHPEMLAASAQLAHVYVRTGRHGEAETLQSEMVELSKKYQGHEHPDTLIAMSDLSEMYRVQGRLKEAEKLSLEVCEANERVLGPEDPNRFYALNRLSRVYYAQDRLKEAEEIASKCLENRSRLLGRENWQTIESVELLAWIRKEQGRLEEAIELMRECVEPSTRTLGSEHWFTKECPKTLDEWQQLLAARAGDACPMNTIEPSPRVAEEEVDEVPEDPENSHRRTESSPHQEQPNEPQAEGHQTKRKLSIGSGSLSQPISKKRVETSNAA